MGRTVADVALLLNGLAAVDDQDPAGPAAANKIPSDYETFLKADALKDKRFGVLRQAIAFHPDAAVAIEGAVAKIKGAGGEVVDIKIDSYDKWNDSEFEVLLYEFKDGLNTYLKASGSAHTLESLIAWNKTNAVRAMPFFGQEIFERAQAKGPLSDAAYKKAREEARRLAGKDGLLAALDRDKLDAVIAASVSPAWPTDYVLGDHFVGAGYSMAAVAGTPSITVPVGTSRGLPLGLIFMGRPYSEGDLLGFAYALEQLTRARAKPEYRPTL
jgi:amidase